MASYKLDPPADEWECSSVMATSIINEIRRAVGSTGGEAAEPLAYDFLVPGRHKADGDSDDDAVDGLYELEGLPE